MAATWMTQAMAGSGVWALGTQSGGQGSFGLWALFSQSFDLFTVVLVGGSLAGIALIVRCVLEVREARILPSARASIIRELAQRGRLAALREEVDGDETFLGRTVRAALSSGASGGDGGGAGLGPGGREAAELTASEECARLFRAIEPLNIIGNLGPLVGLAGTVWGMILAFTSLGETGGQAGASDLSLGISKALFHTLLGLLLAIPCLLAYGLLRARVDRICNRGMILAGEIVDLLGVRAEAGRASSRSAESQGGAGDRNGSVDGGGAGSGVLGAALGRVGPDGEPGGKSS